MKGKISMKKLICFATVLFALFSCLTSCVFTNGLINNMANSSEATPKVEEMLNALTEKRADDAKALLHPQATEKADTAITRMTDYLNGRKDSTVELIDFNFNSSVGTSGNTRQEQATYQVTLDDGEIIYLNVHYLSNNEGTGFVSFQLILGLV